MKTTFLLGLSFCLMSLLMWERRGDDDEEIKRLYGLIEQNFYQNSPVGISYVFQLEQIAYLRNDTHLQAYAKAKIVEYYYPMFDNDSVFITAQTAEAFVRHHKEYRYLFLIQYIIIQRYVNEGEFALGLEKIRVMFDDIEKYGDDEDRARGLSALANMYKQLERYKEAIEFYRESIRLMEAAGKGIGIPLILENYRELALAHKRLKEYDKVLLYADSMRIAINRAADDGVSNNRESLFIAECFTLYAFSKQGELARATTALAKMESLYSMDFPRSFRVLYLQTLASYHKAKGEYEKAYTLNEELLVLVDLLKTPNQRPDILRRKAELLSSMGRPAEAVPVYEKAIERQLAYDAALHDRQLNELRTLYEVDKMEVQAEEDARNIRSSRTIAMVLTIIAVFLVILLFIVLRHSQRIRIKNRELARRKNEREQLYAELAVREGESEQRILPIYLAVSSAPPGESMDELYLRIQQFMRESRPYIDQSFNWKTLVTLLDTKERLLRATLKKHLGITVSEFITRQRLDYAKKLLSDTEFTIETIAFDSGFGSRNTFYRLFREHYGVAPDECRKRNEE